MYVTRTHGGVEGSRGFFLSRLCLLRKIMRNMTILASCLIFYTAAFADKGVVVKEDVCGAGNTIIETSDGWYIAAEYYSGVYLYEGDVVFGSMKTYGMEEITRNDGESGDFYIEDWESDIGDAYEELCD